jgi:mRNA interferase RelE/StbE
MPSEAPAARPGRPYKYRLQFVSSAWAEWQGLDGSVKEPLRKLLKKRLDQPHVPGAALHGALAGHYKIKLNKQGYRLVYGVQDDVLIVMVMAVNKREDSVVYQAASARVAQQLADLALMAGKRKKSDADR